MGDMEYKGTVSYGRTGRTRIVILSPELRVELQPLNGPVVRLQFLDAAGHPVPPPAGFTLYTLDDNGLKDLVWKPSSEGWYFIGPQQRYLLMDGPSQVLRLGQVHQDIEVREGTVVEFL